MEDWIMLNIARLLERLGAEEKWLHEKFSWYSFSSCDKWIEEIPYSMAFPGNPEGIGMPYPELTKRSVKMCSVCKSIWG
jgi:hypothetical protein